MKRKCTVLILILSMLLGACGRASAVPEVCALSNCQNAIYKEHLCADHYFQLVTAENKNNENITAVEVNSEDKNNTENEDLPVITEIEKNAETGSNDENDAQASKPNNTSVQSVTPTDTPEPTTISATICTPAPMLTATTIPTATLTPTNTTRPTATSSAKPTATNALKPTATNALKPTATNTSVPTATNTPKPTATDTPVPTVTKTPKPTATNTPTTAVNLLKTEEEILEEAFSLDIGYALSGQHTISGEVIDVLKQYENATVTMLASDRYIQCLNLANGSKLEVGDMIAVTGKLENYNGFVEFDDGCTYKKISQSPTPTINLKATNTPKPTATNTPKPTNTQIPSATGNVPTTEAEILEAAFSLEEGKALESMCTLTGRITDIVTEYSEKYNNITVNIEVDGLTIQCYRLLGGADLGVGDVIVVTGYMKNYKGTIEFDKGCRYDKIGEQPTQWVVYDEQNGVKYSISPNKNYYIADLSEAFGELSICKEINEIPVYEVVSNDKSHSEIASITFLGSIRNIGNNACRNCTNLSDIYIPQGVETIGDFAFAGCTRLDAIMLCSSVKAIGRYAFYNCICISDVVIPYGVTRINEGSFSGCSQLTSLNIPDTVTVIGEAAFADCDSLTSVSIPDSVTSIDYRAFSGCTSLTSVRIPNGIKMLWAEVFYNCSNLYEVSIPDSVKEICDNAFSGCSSLTSVIIPNGVTKIWNNAFYNCSSLTSMCIPNGVTIIGSSAFEHCSSLASVTIPDSVISLGDNIFSDCDKLTSVYTKEGAYAERWIKDNYPSIEIIYY